MEKIRKSEDISKEEAQALGDALGIDNATPVVPAP
jgi:hypothetical protein